MFVYSIWILAEEHQLDPGQVLTPSNIGSKCLCTVYEYWQRNTSLIQARCLLLVTLEPTVFMWILADEQQFDPGMETVPEKVKICTGSCGGLVVSVAATRFTHPGFDSRPGDSPQDGLSGGRSHCEYCTNKVAKHKAYVGCTVCEKDMQRWNKISNFLKSLGDWSLLLCNKSLLNWSTFS